MFSTTSVRINTMALLILAIVSSGCGAHSEGTLATGSGDLKTAIDVDMSSLRGLFLATEGTVSASLSNSSFSPIIANMFTMVPSVFAAQSKKKVHVYLNDGSVK